MNSIKEILTDLGYVIHSEGSTNYSCRPLYRESNNNSALSICKKTGRWFDFVEGHGGSLENLIKRTLNFESDGEVENWLNTKQYQIAPQICKPRLKMPKIFEEIFVLPHNYFIEKGISKKTLNFYNARGVAHSGTMRNRYAFPIPEASGSIVGYAGRLVTGDIPDESGRIGKWKIIGSKKTFQYPYYFNRQYIIEQNEVILTESIGDMLALHETGFKNALVMFGVVISSAILTLLIEINPSRIIVATNNDLNGSGAGNVAADEIASKLRRLFDKNKIVIGLPTNHNDLMKLFEDQGSAGIRGWYNGLSID